MGQTRIIEKRGILIPTQEERESLWMSVSFLILQKPVSQEYLNLKYLPPRGWYGNVTMLTQGYVIETKQLEFYSQRIWFAERYHAQLMEVMGAAFAQQNDMIASIYLRVTVPVAIVLVPNTPLKYPRTEVDEFRFWLDEGVVAQVSLVNEKFTKATIASPTTPVDPPLPTPPSSPSIAPKPGQPPTTGIPGSGAKFEITPPYNPSNNDNGNTYVPPFIPDWAGDDGQIPGVNYRVTVRDTDPQGTVVYSTQSRELQGKIIGVGTLEPSNPSGGYGVKYGNNQIWVVGINYEYGIGGYTAIRKLRIVSVVRI